MKRGSSFLCMLLIGVASCTRANLDAIGRSVVKDGGSNADALTSSADGPIGDGRGDTAVGDVRTDAVAGNVCPSPVLKPGETTQTIQVGSLSRSYILHVPSTYLGTEPKPLVLDFHFINSSAAQEAKTSPYPAQTDLEGVIIAYPNGQTGPKGTAWNIGPCCVSGVDDVAFARAIVQQIQNLACIDPSRVYAVGPSLGGGMAYYLACQAADVFAAIAPSGWDLLQEELADCKPSRSISVISFRGTGDTVVSYDGAYSAFVPNMAVTFLGAENTFQTWSDIDQCTDAPSAEDSDGCSTHSACPGGVEVVLCTKQGGNQDYVNASKGWIVLKRHKL
jgi:polyhydroxybutyrate depolymerase